MTSPSSLEEYIKSACLLSFISCSFFGGSTGFTQGEHHSNPSITELQFTL